MGMLAQQGARVLLPIPTKYHDHLLCQQILRPTRLKRFNAPLYFSSVGKRTSITTLSYKHYGLSSQEAAVGVSQWKPPERYLKCCEPGKKLRVAVLLSGGVDSSVALRLLCAAGHSCTAFYLKIWFQEDFENFWSACPWDEDLKYAKSVCDEVGVELQVVHLTDEYWNNVVSHIISEYRSGRTPNPDVLCNLDGYLTLKRKMFMFAGAFLDFINKMDFDYVASGHYAHVAHPSLGWETSFSVLHLSMDKMKFSDFVAKHIGEMEGILLEAETGDFLGKHRGFWFYTIGQRQGLRLPGGPWYVVEKDIQNNVVFVSRNYFSLDKKRCTFHVGSLNWFSGTPPYPFAKLQCKVRHGPKLYDCDIKFVTGNSANENETQLLKEESQDVAVVRLSEDDQGLAAGQFAAFYEGNVCLGSGIIIDSWGDHSFPVCSKALEIAKMKDKSELQVPVKIKVSSDNPSTGKLNNKNVSNQVEKQKTQKVPCNSGSDTKSETNIWSSPTHIITLVLSWFQNMQKKS